MGQIGSLGINIIFETSDKRILNFINFTQQVSASWANHDIIGGKPKSEFVGANLRKVSFSITLDSRFGIRPRTILENIQKMVEDGTVEKLVIGNKTVGLNKWKITNANEAWNTIYSGGELAKATVALSLEEYL